MPAMPTQHTRYAHSDTRTIPPWKIRMSNNAQIKLLIYDVLFPRLLTRRLQAYSVHIYYHNTTKAHLRRSLQPRAIRWSTIWHDSVNPQAKESCFQVHRSTCWQVWSVLPSGAYLYHQNRSPVFSCQRFLWCQLCCLACDYICCVCRLRFIFTFYKKIYAHDFKHRPDL